MSHIYVYMLTFLFENINPYSSPCTDFCDYRDCVVTSLERALTNMTGKPRLETLFTFLFELRYIDFTKG